MASNIPSKPADAQWTDEQWKAIYASGQDVLVSAAAGSGKTAVLIERLIQKLLAPAETRIDVDELLVVTFTNASAAEMRSRLAEALEKAIEHDPKNEFIRRQLSLLNKAQISTLHSFCLAICRQYAYRIQLDPGFRIGSQDEIALLRDDVLAQVLEQAYRAEEQLDFTKDDMYRLVDSFTSDRNDQEIEKLIERLYEMSRVQPRPYSWLEELPSRYAIADDMTIDELPYVAQLKQAIEYDLIEANHNIQQFLRLSTPQFNLGEYEEVATAEAAMVGHFLHVVQHGTWEDAYEAAKTIEWANMTRGKRPKGFDPADKEMAMEGRNQAKKIVSKITATFFARKPSYLLQEIRNMKPIIETLVKLTKLFSEAFKEAKLARSLVDFSDLEHYALEILTEEDEAGIVYPSQVALEYKRKFKEVLVDEYQDTNRLQETILQLVKSGNEANGNLFMVGDVKQSIVRP